MIKNLLVSLFLLSLFTVNTANAQDISTDNLKTHIESLTANELAGRAPGTPGGDAAAKYVKDALTSTGLSVKEQGIDMVVGKRLAKETAISMDVLIPRPGLPKDKWRKMGKTWEANKDYFPLVQSANASAEGEMVFLGFGITAPEIGYDDYAGVDAKGKIGIILSHSPEGFDREGQFASHLKLDEKIQRAEKNGVIGIIYVKINSDSANVFEPLKNVTYQSKLPIVQANRVSLEKLFPRKKSLVVSESGIMNSKKANSFLIPDKTFKMTVGLEDNKITTNSYYAIKEGTEKKDEYIVISANYDGLGQVESKDRKLFDKAKIMYGADRNASGTAALIELARMFQAVETKRSIIFLALTAEENGMKGSKEFFANCPVDKAKIATFINLNMLGRKSDKKIKLFGIKSSAELSKLVDYTTYKLDANTLYHQGSIGKSSINNSNAAKVPSLLITMGMHDDCCTNKDLSRLINYSQLSKVTEYSYSLVNELANYTLPITYTANDKICQDMEMDQYKAVELEIKHEEDKIIISKVGGAFKKAKLKKGDQIISINEKEVSEMDSYSFREELKKYSDGQDMTIKVLRKEEEKVFTIEASK